MDELTMYGQSNVMFQGLTVNKTGSSQRSSCMQIKPKDVKYHLKAKVQFNETNKDGVTGSINFVRIWNTIGCSPCSIIICFVRLRPKLKAAKMGGGGGS